MTTAASLLAAYRLGETTPVAVIRGVYERIRAYDDPALFITLRPEEDTLAEAAGLEGRDAAALPLYGVPVAIKDNIDVAGLPTTAACPAFSYMPEADATAVARLRAAGALVIGKTNLDQFATGLVGMRSPYGVPRNPFRADLVPGGSSSGSATAVSAGIVPVSLGTDTAGSGRVPAMLNNIVGLKPTLGLISTAGVVPACRTLDCVSVFALTIEDALLVLDAIAGPDPADAFSRSFAIEEPAPPQPGWRLGVVRPADRIFYGDEACAGAYERAIASFVGQGARLVEIDYAPFSEVARLLYDGAWVAERWVTIAETARLDPDALHPVTRQVVSRAEGLSAADAFRGLYRLRELQAALRPVLAGIDAMLVPTAPTVYTLAELEADPIRPNSNLGTYTNFVNFLDLCGLSLPAEIVDGTPYGVTLLAAAGQDRRLAVLGESFEATRRLPLGATGRMRETPARLRPATPAAAGRIDVAVFGAHMRGLPLNPDLVRWGGRFEAEIETAPDYRLYLLPGGPTRRPGLLRVGSGGEAIAAELWSLSPDGFGRLVASVPSPLGFGTIRLADGRQVKGFLVEAAGIVDARDITASGGWRGFLAAEREPA